MSGDERALLDHLLSLDQPGFEHLREQSRQARTIASSPNLVQLFVPRSAPAAVIESGPVVSRAVGKSAEAWADATLWVSRDGYLQGIEIMWPDGAMERLPRPDELSPAIPPP